ncbi:hypothetical protein [Ruegeria sp. ANG-S4]|nr:hypothetical protein [Ruegeria sp. ANG-S4]
MNRNFPIIAAVIVVVALGLSAFRSGDDDVGVEGTAPAAATD